SATTAPPSSSPSPTRSTRPRRTCPSCASGSTGSGRFRRRPPPTRRPSSGSTSRPKAARAASASRAPLTKAGASCRATCPCRAASRSAPLARGEHDAGRAGLLDGDDDRVHVTVAEVGVGLEEDGLLLAADAPLQLIDARDGLILPPELRPGALLADG